MGIEAATYINDLDPANPTGGDSASTLDNHLRLVKQVLINQLGNLPDAALTSAAAAVLNDLGITQAISDNSTKPASTAFVQAVVAAALSSGFTTGVWTPTLSFQTPGNLSVAYSAQVGSYLRLGSVVWATYRILTSTFTHTTALNALEIGGLPFAASTPASGGEHPANALEWQGITKANFTDVVARATSGASSARLFASGSAQSTGNVLAADMPTGGTVRLLGALMYFV